MIRILLAVIVLLAAGLGWALWRAEAHKGAAAEAERRADALAGQVAGLQAAAARDDASAAGTDTARANGEARASEQAAREARIREVVHERLVPVPAVCPDPDPDLVRELAEGAARIRAAEDRLRGLRRAAGEAAE